MEDSGSRSPIFIWSAVFGILVAILLWSRMNGLDHSFWHDEVTTVVRYASQGPAVIFLGDFTVNNHVLFEVFAWATTRMFGEAEAIYRLWGVIPALGAAIWLTWWMCRRFGFLAGACLLLLITLSPLLFEISREARGYGLAMLSMTGLITQGDAAARDPEGPAVWRFALFGAVGVLTLPILVFPFVLIALPLALQPTIRARLLVSVGLAGLISLVWYFPMLADLLEQSSQQFGVRVPWHGWATHSVSTLLFPVYRLVKSGGLAFTLAQPVDPLSLRLVWYLITWTLIAMGGYLLWQRDQQTLLKMLALTVFGTYVVLAALGIWVANRHVSYLGFPLYVLIALGVVHLAKTIPGRNHIATHVGLAGLAVWFLIGFYPVGDRVIHVPHEALKDAAQLANESGADLVVTNSARPTGFQYYLRSPPTIMAAADLKTLFCSDESGYVFLDHPFRAEEVDTSCLVAKSYSSVRLEQRGRGRRIDVWFIK